MSAGEVIGFSIWSIIAIVVICHVARVLYQICRWAGEATWNLLHREEPKP